MHQVSNYDILGISSSAKKEDIKKAYRKLCFIYHPDRPHGDKEKFISIKSAYEALMVPDTTRVHHEHRVSHYVNIISSYLYKSSHRVMIDVIFKNIIHVETLAPGVKKVSWDTYGLNSGCFELKKEFLIACNHKFILVFTTVNGGTYTKDFEYDDPRSKFQKFMFKLKSLWK